MYHQLQDTNEAEADMTEKDNDFNLKVCMIKKLI